MAINSKIMQYINMLSILKTKKQQKTLKNIYLIKTI